MEEVDYHMTDMEETESIADQSLILGDTSSGVKRSKNDIGNFKIFSQLKSNNFPPKKSPNSSSVDNRHSLIQQPNQFPHINTSNQHNDSLGFSTQRSNLSHA